LVANRRLHRLLSVYTPPEATSHSLRIGLRGSCAIFAWVALGIINDLSHGYQNLPTQEADRLELLLDFGLL